MREGVVSFFKVFCCFCWLIAYLHIDVHLFDAVGVEHDGVGAVVATDGYFATTRNEGADDEEGSCQ